MTGTRPQCIPEGSIQVSHRHIFSVIVFLIASLSPLGVFVLIMYIAGGLLWRMGLGRHQKPN